jgi:leucyl-tRNA synthetase
MNENKGIYNFNEIEAKWQNFWEQNKTFAAADGDKSKPKYYVLDMFPYPSAQGLHVGHPEGYTASDIIARYKRMNGFNVLHPIGWDAFGLPAEQYAVQTGTHPAKTTQQNIDNMRRQIKSLGFSYDWDRQVDTTDPKYFKWTQWIFLKLFNSYFDESEQKAKPIEQLPIPAGLSGKEKLKYIDEHRLAYEAEVAVNWCPELGTVLANEEVVGGISERGAHPVIRKPMRQWMLRITKYADRLIDDLKLVDWPDSIKKLQTDWIGKSIGAEVDFKIARSDKKITVFTTRPDTLFGATYMVLAPEHPFVDEITTAEKKKAVADYKKKAQSKSDLDRTDLAKDKTGEFTGAFAVNPVNNTNIPIWISDYVLISYGTGAIMSVPAHDERDFEFAKKFSLPIVPVVEPTGDKELAEKIEKGQYCFPGDGVAINSGKFDGLSTQQFKEQITAWLAERGLGKKAVNYKLRDWLFSRQRYWGEPFPILHHPDSSITALDETQLPLTLPEVKTYKPAGTGESPLALIDEWLTVTLPDGTKAKRETNTMPQWAGSCWYYLRYLDAKNEKTGWSKEKENYWMPVDLYIGGAEHAVLHLLYSRFWHKMLYDLGYVSTAEPFKKLVNQGMILGEDGQKMSKSRGNVVNPDKVITGYGADSMRLYEMFMGPLEATKPWNMQGVEGVHRFLYKVWKNIIDETGSVKNSIQNCLPDEETLRILHQTIKKVTGDIDNFRFNTAISQMMIFINHIGRLEKISKQAIDSFLLLLAPFAPHIAEELWHRLGHNDTLAYESWPKFDEALAQEKEIELAVQILGKIRGKIIVPADADEEQIKQMALSCEKVASEIKGKEIKKIIVIKSRLVNIVTG